MNNNLREVVLKILYETESKSAYSNIALNKHLKSYYGKNADKALITEIVYGIIKYKITIDYIIRQYSRIKKERISIWILNILRMGIYQLIYLDRIPESAAVNESVKLAKRYGHKGSVAYVNGILRAISRNKDNIKFPDKQKDEVGYLTIKYSHPQWLVKRLLKQYGFTFTEELCIANNEIPQLNIRVNTLKTSTKELTKHLQQIGIKVKQGDYCQEALIIDSSGSIEELEAFKNGYFQVQDQGSMIVSKILDPKEGESILDVCCAPGGKLSHIAQIMKDTGKLIGWDIYEHKIDLTLKTLERLAINNTQVKLQDARKINKDLKEKFDKVIVDAPCSGLGIIRRKPDIKWNKSNETIEEITKIQKTILDTASKYVKPGGSLVYSTCTILDEENIQIIKNFIKDNPAYTLENVEGYLDEKIKKSTAKDGYIQLFPHIDGTDGFFICKLNYNKK